VFILCPDKLAVIVPYEDFVELLSLKDKMLEIERQNNRMFEQYDAIKTMYSEMLDIVREIKHYL
jgi:hypothetical protein